MEGEPTSSSQPQAKKPRRSSSSLDSGLSLSSTLSMETTWTVSDIAKAAHLLTVLPRPLRFEDEEEMRRVYSIIYDVFRYKSVLNQALIQTAFFLKYPQFQKQPCLVSLLFYDLYKRRFLPRENHDEPLRAQLFEEAGLQEAETCLWDVRVKLAASLSRLRIKNKALSLSKLLPPHLRDSHVAALDELPVAAWINTFKIDMDEVTHLLEKAGLKRLDSKELKPDALSYVLDDWCPKLIKSHPTHRSDLAQSALVKRNLIVLQDRAFCFGPAVMCKIVHDLDLAGRLVQTHVVSPRTTAYLANILSDNEKIKTLIAFGAGQRKEEYDAYLRMLGVTNTEVRAESFLDVPSDSCLLESVVGVLATPPNTYSGVRDPVDLACSRGGDLSMLEVLTEVEDWRMKRIDAILEEERQTLRLAMSRPQIQAVLYETHSIVPAENNEMVNRMVNEMNRRAHEKHAEELGKTVLASQKEEGLETADENVVAPSDSVASIENIYMREPERPKFTEADVTVPSCDVFEIRFLPGLFLQEDIHVTMEEEGCYLAYLRRKEVVRLNAKYMINIAASRGLFGGETGGSKEAKKSQSGRPQRKKPDLQRQTSGTPLLIRPTSRRVEMERIAAPTQASISRRATGPGKISSGNFQQGTWSSTICQRHQNHFQHEFTPVVGINPKMVAQIRRQDARKWWREAARHIIVFGFNFELDQNSVDRYMRPRLKLSRTKPYYKVPLRVNVASIQFDDPNKFL
ncbi:hypothetical protein B7P43_G10336 [Cryptotermes secundus]|nr:putative methyltransferase NSUN7 isoform X3 [Cryptotermes secundus]PNF21705.1 hypothetical protein B7P43_G10336 [Cryptotermes secundus]